MPVIPYSGATNLEGHTRGVRTKALFTLWFFIYPWHTTDIMCQHPTGGICVDLSNMDQILEIHEADSDLVCQPGARWMDINDTLKDEGSSPAPGCYLAHYANELSLFQGFRYSFLYVS